MSQITDTALSAHAPVINHWYMNPAGQLLKVAMLVYQHGRLANVVLAYMHGPHRLVTIEAWASLKLTRYGAPRLSNKAN